MLNLLPGQTLGGYQLTRRLRDGEGRQVFSAADSSDGRRAVVLKIAALQSPADAGRLEREFAVLREAAGPGVVAALGHTVALPQRMAWLVLAAEGPSLASVLAAAPDQRLATDVALAAIHAAATALGDLHARGWRHGDLKPGNLLCRADGSVALSDLEFAARLAARPVGHSPDLLLAGTPPFIAPELWRKGAAGPTLAADVWALGVTLFLCLYGDYPFGHEDDAAIAEAIDRGLPPRLDELAEPLRELLAALLSRDPEERPTDGRAAARLIATTAQQLAVDLTAARQSFARLVTAVPDGESPAEPGTVTAPPANRASTPTPTPEPPSAPATRPPPQPAAAPPRVNQPEGVGAGDSAEIPLWLKRDFLDISSKIVSLRPPPSPAAPSPTAPSPVAPSPIKPRHFQPPSPTERPAGGRISKPAKRPQAAAAPRPAPAAAPQALTRRAAARWYRRMNPERNFPLSVVFSGKQIRIIGGSGLGITLGQKEIVVDASDPVLSVEPWFPGCLISPPRADVQVSQENTICRFWVTPLVCGDLPEACVTIRYRGKVVETLATPASVVTRTTAKMLAAAGLVLPVVGKMLDFSGWNPVERLRTWLPRAADLLAEIGPVRSGLCVAGLLLVAALGYFYVTRPLLSEDPEPALLSQAA